MNERVINHLGAKFNIGYNYSKGSPATRDDPSDPGSIEIMYIKCCDAQEFINDFEGDPKGCEFLSLEALDVFDFWNMFEADIDEIGNRIIGIINAEKYCDAEDRVVG